ncbi:MAG: alpha-1,2-fucosyltransferase, partial [bacterium]
IKIIKEQVYSYDSSILKADNNSYLDGYWQSEKYFKNIRGLLLKELELNNDEEEKIGKKEKEILSKPNTIAIHFRRGDYITNKKTNKVHGICQLEYYKEALNKVSGKIKKPILIIFSDDIYWVKNNFTTEYETYFFNNPGHIDLVLMSRCEHQIIANSSFSWWGAWLNKNEHKIVIAPKVWFQAGNKDIKDLLPKDWIKI